MPGQGILSISALSGTVCGTDLPALHLAYSSVLSHRMIGNCPENPWGKGMAEVGFQFSLYISSNT